MLAYRFRGSLDPCSAGVNIGTDRRFGSREGSIGSATTTKNGSNKLINQKSIANEEKWYLELLSSLARRYVAGPIYLRFFFT